MAQKSEDQTNNVRTVSYSLNPTLIMESPKYWYEEVLNTTRVSVSVPSGDKSKAVEYMGELIQVLKKVTARIENDQSELMNELLV